MRVTNEMLVAGSLERLRTRMSAFERAQSRLATGRQRLAPSDDPGAASRALLLRSELRSRDQELRNAGDARAWLDVTDSKLQSAVERLQRARDLAVRGGSNLSGAGRDALATEVTQIREELLGIANSRYRGRPLFGGFGEGDAVSRPDPNAVPPTGWQLAAGQAVKRRISDTETVTINVTAAAAFGLDPADPNTNVFSELDKLASALASGDGAGITDGLAGIDGALATISGAQATVGATTNQVESAVQRVQDAKQAVRTELSERRGRRRGRGDHGRADPADGLRGHAGRARTGAASIARPVPPLGSGRPGVRVSMTTLDDATEQDVQVLRFPDGIPGFPQAHRFVLGDLTDDGTFQLLQCVDDPDLSMVVSAPWLFFPDYSPEIPEQDRLDLELEEADDAVVFCSVTADEEDEQLYVNLLGPFIVNVQTLVGRQVVLRDRSLPVRAAVPHPES